MVEPTTSRVSHERAALALLECALEGIDGIEVRRGQGGANRFGVSGWEVTLGQQFQFGDLRVETPATTLLAEVESGGGIGNLVKYWPLLAHLVTYRAGETPNGAAGLLRKAVNEAVGLGARGGP